MSRFVLFLESEHRFITNVEVIAGMSMASKEFCGLVYADGIDGDRFGIRIDAFEDTALFHDHQSAVNAIRHLAKDVPRPDADFRVLCCGG